MKKLTQAQEDKVADIAYDRRNKVCKELADPKNGRRLKTIYKEELALLDGILAAIPIR